MKERQVNKDSGKISQERVFRIAIAVLGILFCVAAVKIIMYYRDMHKSEDYAQKLQEAVMRQPDAETADASGSGEEKDAADPAEMIRIPEQIDLASLQQISADAKAWILSPGTRIDYVIAQAQDNDYYLHRLLDGTEARAGTLFLDYRNQGDFTDWNTIIYGHHMKNGSMFASLMDYQSQSYYEEHPVMYLYLPEHRYRLELIAGYTTGTEDPVYTIPETPEEKQQLAESAMKRSDFQTEAAVDEKDRLVTLSTCSYSYDDARYVVIAKIAEEK